MVLNVRHQMPRIGTRKLHHILGEEFKRAQLGIGRDTLFTILREDNLLVGRKKRYTKTTDSKHWLHKYPNLIKGIDIIRPEQVWVSDITYISIEQGFCYLHLITDGYSKKIMGYHTSKDMAATSTLNALRMAIENRKYKKKVIHHSDRGLQYCSTVYTKHLNANRIAISMTQDGSPYDNAVAERVNGILKDEFGLDEILPSIEAAEVQIKQAITMYNNNRPHLSCGMYTPNQMHNQSKLKIKTWGKKNHKNFDGSCDFLNVLQQL